ncbi:P27 family phage terminase small subunit [Stappia sp. F7233]|uniref:P27 family phage terminase small subunit n=1 Tax=Stappia albiluteola TaxID=2758565 RepID=A0A839AK17_9HYPH|nr:P27 family phage terminase small subunit [Stappia albiluteola]MBA5779485.1 P27 family phage terminase small subunit [Stappia albiluteola]
MKGRKPGTDNVVPLTEEGQYGANLDERAEQKAKELKPRGLSKEVAKVWDRLAVPVCHPTVDRLRPHMVATFALMCEALARYEAIAAELVVLGETYTTEGRNGVQYKSRPEVAQRNEAFRQFLTLARDFGLTPASERGISTAAGQGQLFDPDFA